MSGGSFGYAYRKVELFVDDLRVKLSEEPCDDEPPELIAALLQIAADAERLAKRMLAAEYYYSGDIGPETLMRKLAEAMPQERAK